MAAVKGVVCAGAKLAKCSCHSLSSPARCVTLRSVAVLLRYAAFSPAAACEQRRESRRVLIKLCVCVRVYNHGARCAAAAAAAFHFYCFYFPQLREL